MHVSKPLGLTTRKGGEVGRKHWSQQGQPLQQGAEAVQAQARIMGLRMGPPPTAGNGARAGLESCALALAPTHSGTRIGTGEGLGDGDGDGDGLHSRARQVESYLPPRRCAPEC